MFSLSQNILSYTTYLPDHIPGLSRVFIASSMIGIRNSLERRLHTVVASLTQHGRRTFHCLWGVYTGAVRAWGGCIISDCHSSANMCWVIFLCFCHCSLNTKGEKRKDLYSNPLCTFGEERRIGGGWRKDEREGSGEWSSNSETGIAVAAGQCCHSNQTSNQVWPGGLLVTKITQRHAHMPPPHKNIVIRKLLLKYYVATHHTLVRTKMVFRLFTILK